MVYPRPQEKEKAIPLLATFATEIAVSGGVLPERGELSSLRMSAVATTEGGGAEDVEGGKSLIRDAMGLSQLVAFVSWMT